MELVEFKKEKIDRFAHSNKLIEARYSLSLPEQRLVLMMVQMIKPEDTNFKEYKIDIREFANFFSIKGDSIVANVKKAAKSLLAKVLTIKDDEKTLYTNWISSAEFPDGKSYVSLCFDPKLKPYLLELKEKYTFLENKYLIKLRSVYSIRIYMLLKQYEGYKKERIFELKSFREMLGILPNEYLRLYDLKTNVINRAVADINNKTDLKISCKDGKTSGRKILEIIFTINEKKGIKFDETPKNKDAEEKKGDKTIKIELSKEKEVVNPRKNLFQIQAQFEEFWKDYPKKIAKENAKKAFIKLIKENSDNFDLIIKGLKNYSADIKKQIDKDPDWNFIAHPATWLNGRRFFDEYEVNLPKSSEKPKSFFKEEEPKEITNLRNTLKRELANIGKAAAWRYFGEEIEKTDTGFRIKALSSHAENYKDILQKLNIELQLN